MQDVYINIKDYILVRKCNILIVVDDIIADMIRKKNRSAIETEPFIRGKILLFLSNNLNLKY